MNRPYSSLHGFVKHCKCGSITSGQNNEADLQRMAKREQEVFAYETLAVATKNFNPIHKLGEGGFGPVYKGKLNDGREIAMKKLSQTSNQGKKEFLNESSDDRSNVASDDRPCRVARRDAAPSTVPDVITAISMAAVESLILCLGVSIHLFNT